MSKSILLAQGRMRFLDNQTRYTFPVGSIGVHPGSNSATDTVAQAEIILRDAGVLSKAYCYVETNEIAASTVITLMLNGVATAITMTYTSSEVGAKTDSSNTVTVAAGDKIAWRIAAGSETGTNYIYPTTLKLDFAPTTTDNCVSILAASGPGLTGTGADLGSLISETRYWGPSCDIERFTLTTAETLAKYHSPFAFTSRNLYVYVVSNSRTTSTVFRTRVNGVNGNQTVTVGAGATGVFEDVTNSDSIAADDDFDYSVTFGASDEAMNVVVVSTTCVSTSRYFPLAMTDQGEDYDAVSTSYGTLAGRIKSATFTTEASAHVPATFAFTVTHLMVHVPDTTNTLTGGETETITLRDNGSDSELAVIYATTQDERKTDTGSVSISIGDEIAYTVVNTGNPSRSADISLMAILCQTVDDNLNTRCKRASSVKMLQPWLPSEVLPDGTIDQGDRQHIAWTYCGILAAGVGGVTRPALVIGGGING